MGQVRIRAPEAPPSRPAFTTRTYLGGIVLAAMIVGGYALTESQSTPAPTPSPSPVSVVPPPFGVQVTPPVVFGEPLFWATPRPTP